MESQLIATHYRQLAADRETDINRLNAPMAPVPQDAVTFGQVPDHLTQLHTHLSHLQMPPFPPINTGHVTEDVLRAIAEDVAYSADHDVMRALHMTDAHRWHMGNKQRMVARPDDVHTVELNKGDDMVTPPVTHTAFQMTFVVHAEAPVQFIYDDAVIAYAVPGVFGSSSVVLATPGAGDITCAGGRIHSATLTFWPQ
ncbi:ORF41R [Turbot reddish body iridovirus]|uniref:ORF41R n=1 Tax=Turbot reddish body iridovirus TaxID=273651 RepID=E2CTY6_ISKNV|nr:ORF41R [Turbot reddish body iridovirus]